MEEGGRSKRNISGPKKASSALQQLQELRRTKAKQASVYEIREEQPVYDVVDDDDYADIVAKRRREGGDFIDDDDGMGYVEFGEEDDWGRADEEAEKESTQEPCTKKRKDETGQPKGGHKKRTEPSRAEQQRAAQMFMLTSNRSTTMQLDPKVEEAADALLDELLNDDSGSAQNRLPVTRPSLQRTFARAAPHASTGRIQGSRLAHTSSNAAVGQRPTQSMRYKEEAVLSPPSHLAERCHMDSGFEQLDNGSLSCRPMDLDIDVQPMDMGPSSPPQDEEDATVGQQKPEVEHRQPDSKEPEACVPNSGSATDLPLDVPKPVKEFFPAIIKAEAVAVAGWQEMYDVKDDSDAGMEDAASEAPAWVDDGSLPLDGDGKLPFYFMDAHEEASTPATIYMFGKVPQGNGFVSCCAVVHKCMRNILVVPRPDIFVGPRLQELENALAANPAGKKDLVCHLHELATDLKAEVRELLARKGINKFVLKPVKRSYAFENQNVPHCEQWVLKVRYDAALPMLDLGLTGTNFIAIFGSQQSILESVLLKRRINGPSWLSLERPSRVDSCKQVSWSKLEVELATPKALFPLEASRPPPPLLVAALNIKTTLDPKTCTNEIVAASVVYVNGLPADRPCPKSEWNKPPQLRHFSVVRKLGRQEPFPAGLDARIREANESRIGKLNGGNDGRMLSQQSTEAGLLNYLLGRLEKLDADVYCGHNIAAFDMDVLLHRLQHHKVANWSRLGRLKRSKMPHLGGGGHVFGGGASAGLLAVLAGRLLCDTYLAARELVKSIDFTLGTLAANLLGQQRSELSAADIPGKYETATKLLELVQHTEGDAWLALGLTTHLNVIPLTRELSCISGYLWSRTLQGQRAARIEMLLLHEFYKRKFVLPDKLTARERNKLADQRANAMDVDDDPLDEAQGSGKSKGPQYAGGLVLEPKRGLYDRFVLLLDFNSLYPSIIQEYNICFTTVSCPTDGGLAPLPQPSDQMAILPTVISKLVEQRRAVKRQKANERNPLAAMQLDVRQQALKLTANSMYGCLGFSSSRFYAKPLAELITAQGREVLQSTVDTVQGTIGANVIYGDTDSIMVATGSDDLGEVQKLGKRIKEAVNKRYRKLELEMDGIFKVMLLLKKKKYAAVVVDPNTGSESQEIKGLDMVRRDWSGLAKDVGKYVLNKILSGLPSDEVVEAIHQHLRQIRNDLDEGNVPLDRFIITKQLTKRPEDYPAKEARTQPHVVVALRRKAAHLRGAVMQGETVPYIICIAKEDGEAATLTSGERPSKGVAERAYHPDEVTASSNIVPDLDYYLAQQVHPLVARLCGPIEGTDHARLADCLGLDSAKYHSASHPQQQGYEEQDAAPLTLDDDTRFQVP
eukprot:jgi/Botrbrau1/20185/Bobra.0173s0083.2